MSLMIRYIGTGDIRELSSSDLLSLGIEHNSVRSDKRCNRGLIEVSNELAFLLRDKMGTEWAIEWECAPVSTSAEVPEAFVDDTHVVDETETEAPPAAEPVVRQSKKRD